MNLTVTKSNFLVEASYRLTLEEQRLLLTCIAQIKTNEDIPNELTITVSEYANIFGIQSTHAYEQVKNAAHHLYERDMKLFDPSQKTNGRLRWVYKIKYHDGQAKVTLGFSPDIKPYLAQLKGQFTSYKLCIVANLKSIYSIRLYELLMQFKATKERMLTIEKFRGLLEIKENQYPRFADIRRWVLQPAVNELNIKTNLIIEWKALKQGRKINSLLFKFKENGQMKLELD